MKETGIDRSLAFTALFEMDPEFAHRTDGSRQINELLEAWYAQEGVRNMWNFAKQWLMERRLRAAGRRLEDELSAAGDNRDLRQAAWDRHGDESQAAGDWYRSHDAYR